MHRRPLPRAAALAAACALLLAAARRVTPPTPTSTRSRSTRWSSPSSAPAATSPPQDVAQPANATQTVDCAEKHTAETYAVGDAAGPLRGRRPTTTWTSATFAYKTCSDGFEKFLGADESLVMRTVVSWAWFRPSEKAWDDGARWYRCDVVGGGEQSAEFVRCPRPPRACSSAAPRTAGWSARPVPRSPATARSPATSAHNWRAVTTIKVGRPRGLPRRPARRGEDQRVLLRTRSAPGSTTRSTTTSATPGSTRPSGRPATAGPSAGRRRTSDPTGSRCGVPGRVLVTVGPSPCC